MRKANQKLPDALAMYAVSGHAQGLPKSGGYRGKGFTENSLSSEPIKNMI
jgi:hypothetical protein